MAERVKHTEGPWRHLYSERFDNYQIHSVAPNGMGHWIANTKCESVPAHHEANARLIAAAPEMLAALQKIAAEDDTGPLVYEQTEDGRWRATHNAEGRFAEIARAAISKAETSNA